MNKNQKIALGCGGAGCLGLIVVVVAGVVFWLVLTPRRSLRNITTNSNTSANRNSNSDADSNSNSNSDVASKSSTSMSDDDRHKLYQAAAMTGDAELVRRVSVKLGLMKEDYTQGEEYATFVKDHFIWAIQNTDFISSLDTKEKAVAYVNKHFSD